MDAENSWKRLSKGQIGRYGEYIAMMEFTRLGFDVYSAEVDDKGIDFVVRTEQGRYYDIQVKSARGSSSRGFPPINLLKAKSPLRDNFLVCVVLFTEDESPELFLIRSTEWQIKNALLASRDYGGEKKSSPEWGLNVSRRNWELLQKYHFSRVTRGLLEGNAG